MNDRFPFQQKPLPYDLSALTGLFTPTPLYLHLTEIYYRDIDALNFFLSPVTQYHGYTLKQLFTEDLQLTTPLKNNIRHYAGSVHNHELFFTGLAPDGLGEPFTKLGDQIKANFGDMSTFRRLFGEAAFSILGSGWVWLVSEESGQLHIVITSNNEVPSVALFKPILILDKWEHSYYMDYNTNLQKYIENWFSRIDWARAETRFLQAAQ